ncbi:hypothetical protein QA596_00660 [Balneolales bacterium ANBcel1]|nr:hypothetical protein [Balneolales bacterium ANBcel1]
MSPTHPNDAHYIETPRGIFTSAGNWFHITKQALETYAPGLLKKQPLARLIKKAEIWIRSADNIGIILFMMLLYSQGPVVAAIATALFVPVWHVNKSSFLSLPLTSVLSIVDKELVVVLISIVVLSWMGITGQYLSVVVGIVFFCILKFGLFRWLVEWLYSKMKQGRLLLNDRVLKMIILKYAIREDIPVKEVDAMEKEILSLIRQQKEVIKKYRKKRK